MTACILGVLVWMNDSDMGRIRLKKLVIQKVILIVILELEKKILLNM